MNKLSLMLSLSFLTVVNAFKSSPASSQITAGENSTTTITEDSDNYTIENGETLGDNLFHTFEQFSIPIEGEAIFNNSENINNIFSRVTGGQLSEIDGLIRANGTANLFLINPAGIMFGENASLAIGGSFYGSTADSILFENGEFSAIAPETPTLVINAPIGFTFRDNPAAIALSGSSETSLNLQVSRGESFNLIGGDINLSSAQISLVEGSIELASISQAGTIDIDGNNNLTISENSTRGNITLDNSRVQIISIGQDSGNLNLTAKTLSLFNSSRIINTAGLEEQNIAIATANAGDINIDTINSVTVEGDSAVFANTFTQGSAGNITIEAGNSLTIQGTNTNSFTGIASSAGSRSTADRTLGSAGNIQITAKNIALIDGARINSDTFGAGDGGQILFQGDNIDLDRNSNISASVGSLSSNSATGNGGLIDINTRTLSLNDGATIITQTFAPGNAGRIDVNASESVSISGVAEVADLPMTENSNPGSNSSGLISGTEPNATGLGGEITVTTPRLQLSNGGVISARSRSDFDAGNINVDTEVLEITGGSQILTTAFAGGNAGNINLDVAERLSISGSDRNFNDRFSAIENATDFDQAQFTIDPVSEFSGVFANTDEDSTATGGNISIGRFSVVDGNLGLNSTQFTSEIALGDRGEIAVNSAGNGDGGNILLNTARLTLNRDSTISARALQGNGGNININTNNGVVAAFRSLNLGNDIVASASETGGNITISAEAVLGLAEGIAFRETGDRLNNRTSDLDASGELESGTVEIDASEINPIEGIPQLDTNPIEANQSISQMCDATNVPTKIGLIFNGKGGVQADPTAPLVSNELSGAGTTASEKLSHSPLTINTSAGNIVPAMGAEIAADGTVSLVSHVTSNPNRDANNSNCRPI